eukprot:SAG31_NODE_43920_length_265_cov_0.620482_1_plen_51_part_10
MQQGDKSEGARTCRANEGSSAEMSGAGALPSGEPSATAQRIQRPSSFTASS